MLWLIGETAIFISLIISFCSQNHLYIYLYIYLTSGSILIVIDTLQKQNARAVCSGLNCCLHNLTPNIAKWNSLSSKYVQHDLCKAAVVTTRVVFAESNRRAVWLTKKKDTEKVLSIQHKGSQDAWIRLLRSQEIPEGNREGERGTS